MLEHIRSLPGCTDIEHKESPSPDMPFLRMKVRLKKEIVTMGVPTVDPTSTVGTYVDPENWNELISDPDVVLIDTRNDYEVGIGTFQGAINPGNRNLPRVPGLVREIPRREPQAQDCHVLHRRDPLREIDRLCQIARY